MKNRLQLRHHTPIFETRDDAIEYIYSEVRRSEEGLSVNDKAQGFSLFAEPTVLRYKNEADETNPHVIIAIGSDTNPGVVTGNGQYADNKFCIIDPHKTESEIADLKEEIEQFVTGLSVVNSNTISLSAETTEEGQVLSADVIIPKTHIFETAKRPNIILSTEDGVFSYVDLNIDDNGKMVFTVNEDVKEWSLENNFIVSGYYDPRDESIHLVKKDGENIAISMEALINEWGVEGDSSKTPIVLTREEVGYGSTTGHSHIEPYQDVLKADVRLADMRRNILKKTSDGRYLYVDGTADNITYFKDGAEITVAEALNKVTKGLSSDSSNLMYEKADGYFASASLKYDAKTNTLTFTASNVNGGTTVETMKLNVVELFKSIYYDSITEELVILYVDNDGDVKEVRVPIGQMMQDWEWDIVNEGHNVKLHKDRVISGSDKVSADVSIYVGNDNILEDVNHQLLVRGTAENIKYGNGSDVKAELDKLNAKSIEADGRIAVAEGAIASLGADLEAEVSRSTNEDARISDRLEAEITRSKEKDFEQAQSITDIQQTVGNGFSTDGHGTVTYKFNELERNLNLVSAKTDNMAANVDLLTASVAAEVQRSTSEDRRIEGKFDDQIGTGFSIRNSVRDEIDGEKFARESADNALDRRVTALESEEGKVVEVINTDHSINVDKTNASKPVIKVNISDELISGKPNVIKLNNDGIYAGVDLEYSFNEDTGANVLFFTTTNGTKKIELKTNSEINKIYYDPTRELIVVEYTVNGRRMPDVEIPVGDLINEWRVSESTNGAIRLTLTRNESGKDVLYAASVISDHEDNIVANDGGSLYATASLEYVEATNTLVLKGTNGTVLSTQQLGPGSIIDDISYDSREKDLVITYHNADGTTQVLRFPVADLFNEWDVQNQPEGSAIELTKTSNVTETGTVDLLKARVLLTGAVERPDGTIDYGNNLIRIVNNGLYVDGDSISEAIDIAGCTKTELREVEKAVFGLEIGAVYPCGSGFSYRPHTNACVISGATSLDDADVLLNNAICELSYEDECARQEINAVETVLGVSGNCDTPISYPTTRGCLLSGATSFANADELLEEALCNIDVTIESDPTDTADTDITTIDGTKHLSVDVRLSHGSNQNEWQTEGELKITSLTDPDFTDTNVLRYVGITGQPNDSGYNGLYLENVWDCGEYTVNGQGTPGNKYQTDESPTAGNYYNRVYMNSKRT